MKILVHETRHFEELQNIKILFVTGGCGFIGSNFINIFSKKYPHVFMIYKEKNSDHNKTKIEK